jgi:hypothetical protein
VRDLQVHFPSHQQPDHPLKPGVHRVVQHDDGSVSLAAAGESGLLLAQFCLDRRGLWLRVADGSHSIHVNGRPVLRLALLRAGDAVFIEGVEMWVRGSLAAQRRIPAAPATAQVAANDPCMLLRGVGGQQHGRAFTLDRMRVVGCDPLADIVIAEPAFAHRHARLERHGDALLLRDLGSEDGSLVNGVSVRDCWLQAGDQLVFETRHRFVVEAPQVQAMTVGASTTSSADSTAAPTAAPAVGQFKLVRWPLLLLSALLLAALLSALLWFGAH